jgi:hypothetical protein
MVTEFAKRPGRLGSADEPTGFSLDADVSRSFAKRTLR